MPSLPDEILELKRRKKINNLKILNKFADELRFIDAYSASCELLRGMPIQVHVQRVFGQ